MHFSFCLPAHLPFPSELIEKKMGAIGPFMALGGMGDLLSGVVAARWAYLGGDAFLPAAASAWIHGAAGDALVADGGDMSIVNMAARIGSMRILLDRMYSTDFN